jgi:hypothetical protein
MVPTLFFYQLGLVALMYVFLMLCWLWPNNAIAHRQPLAPWSCTSNLRLFRRPANRVEYLCSATIPYLHYTTLLRNRS